MSKINKDGVITFGLYCISLLGLVTALQYSGADNCVKSIYKQGLKVVDEAGDVVELGVKLLKRGSNRLSNRFRSSLFVSQFAKFSRNYMRKMRVLAENVPRLLFLVLNLVRNFVEDRNGIGDKLCGQQLLYLERRFQHGRLC